MQQERHQEWLESHDVSASGSKVVVSPSPGDVEPDLLDDQQEVVGHEFMFPPLQKDQMARRL